MAAENTTEVLTGGAVLAVAVGFLVYAGQVAGLSGGQPEYELSASFRSAKAWRKYSSARPSCP